VSRIDIYVEGVVLNVMVNELEKWNEVKQMLGHRSMSLGAHWAYNLLNDPKRLSFVLSRYKFASKMIPIGQRVLELGCSEGIGASILCERAGNYMGVDFDQEAISVAQANFNNPKVSFLVGDFMGNKYGVYDVVVSLDVIEHINSGSENVFFDTICRNLDTDGIAILGTPNETSASYASSASIAGHVNLFSGNRLRQSLQKYFRNVLLFGMNDEVVHTGFTPMSHYLIAVACYKRECRAT